MRLTDVHTVPFLGYIVGSSVGKMLHCDELLFTVQSQWLGPRDITTRIEGFLEHYQRLRDATITLLEEKPKNLQEEVGQNCRELSLRRFDFDRRLKQATFLKYALAQHVTPVSACQDVPA